MLQNRDAPGKGFHVGHALREARGEYRKALSLQRFTYAIGEGGAYDLADDDERGPRPAHDLQTDAYGFDQGAGRPYVERGGLYRDQHEIRHAEGLADPLRFQFRGAIEDNEVRSRREASQPAGEGIVPGAFDP